MVSTPPPIILLVRNPNVGDTARVLRIRSGVVDRVSELLALGVEHDVARDVVIEKV